MEYGDPIRAEVTWNGSKSYRFAGNNKLIFKEAKTQTITETELIKRCQNTAGFSVRVLETYKPKKRIRPTVKNGKASGSSKSKKTKKKATKRSSYSD
jgi:hypothetical protein